MTDTAAAPTLKLGFSLCSTCSEPVHYLTAVCRLCGGPNLKHAQRAARIAAEKAGMEQEAVVVEHPSPPPDYVMVEKYRTQLGDVMCDFPKGKVISDPNLVGKLVSLGAPIMLAAEAAGFVCCPECKHMFAPKQAAKASKRAG